MIFNIFWKKYTETTIILSVFILLNLTTIDKNRFKSCENFIKFNRTELICKIYYERTSEAWSDNVIVGDQKNLNNKYLLQFYKQLCTMFNFNHWFKIGFWISSINICIMQLMQESISHIKYKALNKRCHDLMDVTVHKNSGSIQNVPHWWDFLFLLLLSKGYEWP
jgi:hypothetical protein